MNDLTGDAAVIAAARRALAVETGDDPERLRRLHDAIAGRARALIVCAPHERSLESAAELDEIAAELREFMR